MKIRDFLGVAYPRNPPSCSWLSHTMLELPLQAVESGRA